MTFLVPEGTFWIICISCEEDNSGEMIIHSARATDEDGHMVEFNDWKSAKAWIVQKNQGFGGMAYASLHIIYGNNVDCTDKYPFK